MSTAPRLAPMETSHLPQVFDIERRAYRFPWTEANFTDSLAAGYCAWVLLDDGGRVLGYAVMSLAGDAAELLNITVDPDHRRRGHARRLMDQLLAIARAARLPAMLLEVRVSNEAALMLYMEYGFTQIGLRRNYYRAESGRREDARVLSLSLK